MTEKTPTLIFSDQTGIRGVGACRTARVTRRSDGASMLLHAIDAALEPRLKTAVFESGPPDFRRPFVTRITRMAERQGVLFLVEPLPPAVPLLDVWVQVLCDAPEQTVRVVRELTRQLGQALEPLHAARQSHGAVGLENIVLTTTGIYGLLVARLPSTDGCLWLRPLRRQTSTAHRDIDQPFQPAPYESIAGVVAELTDIAATTNVLSRSQWSELAALGERELTGISPPDNEILIG